MDLSAVIFVALALAWAAYLVPKALAQAEDEERTRSVTRFSRRMRVLLRQEGPATAGESDTADADASADGDVLEVEYDEVVERVRLSPRELRFRREVAREAAQRRRRVLGVVVGINVVVAVLAAVGVVGWAWQAGPVILLVTWLTACRLMVRGELAADLAERTVVRRVPRAGAADRSPAPSAAVPSTTASVTPDDVLVVENEQGFHEVADEAETSTIPVTSPAAAMWDPVPMMLPTYVGKPNAPRGAGRLDLDSTGSWSSGRNEEDSRLAQEARTQEAAEREARRDRDSRGGGRAVGS